MDNIIEPNDTFDFSQMSLAHPTGVQGGAYFTNIQYNNKPLYIQTCKSLTKQGFVKTGKKYYCDLMFDKNSETLINWFENLEEKCQKLIFEKRDSWFQNTLEENDIETAFNSTIRVYKSGKCYLVRTNVKNNISTNLPAIKIYNENEVPLTMEDITSETYIICILEIQGIKFTPRNFQIEIELKQVMALDKLPAFDNCMIKTNKKQEVHINEPIITTDILETNKTSVEDVNYSKLGDIKANDKSVDNKNHENALDDGLEQIDIMYDAENDDDNISLDIEIEDLNIDTNEEETDALTEFNLDLKLDSLETLQLKKPNQVYFELYKEARNKAKLAKKSAILAYLEAKNIKKTYLIENVNDSDSDFDAEIEDVSESELEGL